MTSLGFVGGGFIAQIAHLPSFHSIEGVRIECLADPFTDLRGYLSNIYSISQCVASHRDLPDSSVLDGVIVTLPRRLSYGVLKELASRSYTILTEKPLCLDLNHANELLSLSKEYSSNISVGYMRRYDPAVGAFKKLINQLSPESIVSINAVCHMGNSYAKPFGQKRGIICEEIQYELEEYPSWLNENLHTPYEQFLNVFSHITDLTEFIFEDNLHVVDHSIDSNGEGLLLANLDNTPIVFDLMRGKQHKWRESITVNTHNQIIRLVLGPAFLRNSPGSIEIEAGANSISDTRLTPDWGWSFRNQAVSFVESLSNTDSQIPDTFDSAIRQVSLAESIFRSI